ncbi:hypothetical protein BDK92_6208 [Micromonospora pisi]|uniref:Uncharacterized protein n=1 Tax=Micromonospora pisi TaxID=589240 RepID=A0A495JS37_9ACTN|nr:hypothetical protein [Micromonospora pisi]RKR91796.1 hypothetical protein BDK92_6208 [Micromonospora pisi]
MLFDTPSRLSWWRWLPAPLLWSTVALIALRVSQPGWWRSLTPAGAADPPAVAVTGAAVLAAGWIAGLLAEVLSVAGAENGVRAGQAAFSYSCRSPPS